MTEIFPSFLSPVHQPVVVLHLPVTPSITTPCTDAVHGERASAQYCHNRFIWSLSLLWIKDQPKGKFPLCRNHPAVRLLLHFVLRCVTWPFIYVLICHSRCVSGLRLTKRLCEQWSVSLCCALRVTQQVGVVLVWAIAQSRAGAVLCYCDSHRRAVFYALIVNNAHKIPQLSKDTEGWALSWNRFCSVLLWMCLWCVCVFKVQGVFIKTPQFVLPRRKSPSAEKMLTPLLVTVQPHWSGSLCASVYHTYIQQESSIKQSSGGWEWGVFFVNLRMFQTRCVTARVNAWKQEPEAESSDTG